MATKKKDPLATPPESAGNGPEQEPEKKAKQKELDQSKPYQTVHYANVQGKTRFIQNGIAFDAHGKAIGEA